MTKPPSTDAVGLDPAAVYRRRFGDDLAFRQRMWAALCRDWFQRWVAPNDVVVELGAGLCEFINHIDAARRIAVDLSAETGERAGPGVEFLNTSADQLEAIDDAEVDVVFMSNLLEHLDRPTIRGVFEEAARILRPGGRMLILQPNIRFAARDYWMFFDHITPIDDRALCELAELTGFSVERCTPRFLPYTTQGRLPKSVRLLRAYLKLPVLWRVFGGQAFVVLAR